jgi:hypothetical protein
MPITVRFERVRRQLVRPKPPSTKLEFPETIVYSWQDQVLYSGQELRSSVPLADRRLLVEFKDPVAWRDVGGDTLDAVRLVVGNDSQQIEMSEPGIASIPPFWTAIPTPGRTCADRMRLAVFGSRVYREKTVEIENGRVLLERPEHYRAHNWPYFTVGAGIQWYDFPRFGQTYGELGFGVSINLQGFRKISFNGEGALSLSQTLYGPLGQPNDLEPVTYFRAAARGSIEIWHKEGRHSFVGLGGGFGVPLNPGDNSRAGFGSWSWLAEGGGVIRLGRRFALVFTGGLRFHENRYEFESDFLGAPSAKKINSIQPYTSVRLRIGAG